MFLKNIKIKKILAKELEAGVSAAVSEFTRA